MTQEVGVALSNPGVEPSVMAFQMPQSVVPDQGSTVSLWLILALAALGFYVLYGVIYLIVRSYFPDRVDLFPFVPWPNAAPIVVIKLPTLAPEPPPPPLPRRTLVQHGGTVNYPVSSSQGVLLLEAIAGPLKGDRIKVDRTNFQVGAGTNNDLRIDSDTYLSGSHALFQMSSGQWQVLDQDSRNGTFLDGKKVAVGRGHALRDGQVVRMGASEFKVVLGDAQASFTDSPR